MKNSLKIIATIHDNGEIQTLKLKKNIFREKRLLPTKVLLQAGLTRRSIIISNSKRLASDKSNLTVNFILLGDGELNDLEDTSKSMLKMMALPEPLATQQ